jgi:SPP1 family predicted phage head-tail adaptor
MPSYPSLNNPLAINPGELRHSITIQKQNSTVDGFGEPVSTWETVTSLHAKIENTGSAAYKQSFSGNALASQSTDLITTRWAGPTINIEPGMRIVFGDNTYTIQAVDNVLRRNRVIRMACLVIDGDSN